MALCAITNVTAPATQMVGQRKNYVSAVTFRDINVSSSRENNVQRKHLLRLSVVGFAVRVSFFVVHAEFHAWQEGLLDYCLLAMRPVLYNLTPDIMKSSEDLQQHLVAANDFILRIISFLP